MGFFNRRCGPRPAPRLPADESQHGIRSALGRFIDTSTLISLTYNGQHKRLPIVTTLDVRAIPLRTAVAGSPVIVLGESTLARLQTIFQDICKRTLSFALMPLPQAMAPGQTLSRVRLVRFLRNVQGETGEMVLDRDRYTFEDFVEVLFTMPGWDAQRPTTLEPLDLSHPISHYFVSSSHNTYLVGNQLSSDASVDEYRKVLENNCRCIEIDVWNPPARSGRTTGRGSGRPAQARSKSPSNRLHRRHISSNSVATSIHEGIDAVTSLIKGKTALSHSRASSFSQMSLSVPHHRDAALNVAVPGESGPQEVLQRAMATAAVEDDDAVEDAAEGPVPGMSFRSTTTDASTAVNSAASDGGGGPPMSRTASTVITQVATLDGYSRTATDVSAATKISVTAPDADTPVEVRSHALDLELDETAAAAEAATAALAAATTSMDSEPVVMHAHTWANSDWTLGTQVPFRDVCRMVRATAFVNNPQPLIVSLEVHTNAMQQRQMVKIMREEWGDLLLDQALDGTDPRLRLPTLEELQNKILVKVKKPALATSSAGGAAATTATTAASTADCGGGSGNGNDNGNGIAITNTGSNSNPRSTVLHHVVNLGMSLSVVASENVSGASSEDDGPSGATSGSSPHNPITPELGSLAVYTESKRYSDFSDRAAKVPGHIFSLSETAIQALHIKKHEELFQHNKKYLMRAYPSATKHVTSSNPDPARCWRRGVQMVALNWQTLDKAMMLNHAMFAGSQGWILKPPGYRTPAAGAADRGGDRCPVAAAEATCTVSLYITVLAGQHLPLPLTLQKRGGNRSAAATGIMSGRVRRDFHPVVRCELNVERADERCPEIADAATSPAGTAATTTTAVLPDTRLKQKTPAGRTDQPDWGARGATLRFMNVTGIVESLSFVGLYVEDENSKPTVSLNRNDALAGWACIRLDQLQTGYRFVSLMDARGNATDGKLLVLIEKVVQ